MDGTESDCTHREQELPQRQVLSLSSQDCRRREVRLVVAYPLTRASLVIALFYVAEIRRHGRQANGARWQEGDGNRAA